jgi:hypothetical protein
MATKEQMLPWRAAAQSTFQIGPSFDNFVEGGIETVRSEVGSQGLRDSFLLPLETAVTGNAD